MALTVEVWRLMLVTNLAACHVPGPGSTPPKNPLPVPDPAASATLGQDDVVEIKVFREETLTGMYRVGVGGAIDYPLIGSVELKGKTAEQVAENIRERLADGFIREPHVSVFVREFNSAKIHVFGQVNKAGTFKYEAGMSVVQAITNAGGFTSVASVNGVKVTRVEEDREKMIEVHVQDIGAGKAPNFVLRPGDIVFVPEAIF